MKKKLRSQAGETLAETLITVLIIAVAMTMLAGMISATASMVKTSETKMNEYYQISAALETFSEVVNDQDQAPTATITVTKNSENKNLDPVKIEYAKNEVFTEHTVIAYRMTDD